MVGKIGTYYRDIGLNILSDTHPRDLDGEPLYRKGLPANRLETILIFKISSGVYGTH
jgi:hypothetical protein